MKRDAAALAAGRGRAAANFDLEEESSPGNAAAGQPLRAVDAIFHSLLCRRRDWEERERERRVIDLSIQKETRL